MLRAMFLKGGLRLKNSIPPEGNPSLNCFGRRIKVPDFGNLIQTAGSWADLEESFSYSDFHDSDDNLKVYLAADSSSSEYRPIDFKGTEGGRSPVPLSILSLLCWRWRSNSGLGW